MISLQLTTCVVSDKALIASAISRPTVESHSFLKLKQPSEVFKTPARLHQEGAYRVCEFMKTKHSMAAVEGRATLTKCHASDSSSGSVIVEDEAPKTLAIDTESLPVIYDSAGDRELFPVEGYPGISMKFFRPTTAVFKFTAGFIEPAHHHTLTHDVYLISGRQIVQNVTKGTTFEVNAGDFLSTPGGDVHRVLYLTDAELFAKFDGTDAMALPENNKLEIIETVEEAREAFGDWIHRVGEI